MVSRARSSSATDDLVDASGGRAQAPPYVLLIALATLLQCDTANICISQRNND